MGRFWGVLLRRCIAAILPLSGQDGFLTEFKTISEKLSESGFEGWKE